jgi:hypothetical protein
VSSGKRGRKGMKMIMTKKKNETKKKALGKIPLEPSHHAVKTHRKRSR